MLLEYIRPGWDCHPNVRALVTTRRGGVSKGPYTQLNFGLHVGDDREAVHENRARLEAVSAPCVFLDQVHGSNVVEVRAGNRDRLPVADAVWTEARNLAICVLTADCFPLMLAKADGTLIGLAHCGWRPLVAGVVPKLVAAMPARAGELHAWIGPGISAPCYEVGDALVHAMLGLATAGLLDGVLVERDGRIHADLARLIRNQLAHLGVGCVPGTPPCTFSDQRFFSHRRDGPATGRFASVLWMDAEKAFEA